MKKLSIKTVLTCVTYTAVCLCAGKVLDGLLCFGLFVGAIYTINPLIASVIYLASSAVYGWQSLLHAVIRAVVIVAFWLIHKFTGKKIGKGKLLLYTILANVYYCAVHFDTFFTLFDKLFCTAAGIAFGYVCIYVFRALFVRGVAYKMQLDEQICLGIFVVVATFCLSKIELWTFPLVLFVLPFAILFCLASFGEKVCFVSSILMGLGNLLSTGLYDNFAFCVISALFAVLFFNINRYVSAIGVLVVDVIMSYLFNLHGQFTTIVFVPTIVSTFLFVLMPNCLFDYLRDCSGPTQSKYLGKSFGKKIGTYLSRRLYRLSEIFLAMKNTFLTLSVGRVSQAEAQLSIVKGCCDRVCRHCAERTNCWRQNVSQTENDLLKLADCALSRGKITILDVPQSLSVKCDRVSAIISETNSQAQTYAEYLQKTQQADGSKLLLGEQMGGVSSLLLQLASECKSKIIYDSEKEKELVERLVFHNIMCVGATIAQQANLLTVAVTISQRDVDNPTIQKVVSGLTKQNMVVEKIEQTENASWVNVYLTVQPRYNVSFGVSSIAKDGKDISGDTHSTILTDNGKCIVALCDGMGSGQRAEQMSSTAIQLVENFYRAGFDNDVILSCVNKLLTSCDNETFCAVDIAVVDLYNGLTDLIKLGASIGLVKIGEQIEIVSGSSLPLGVLDEMTPAITKKAMSCGDIVVLFSDGVVDCFSDVKKLAQIFSEYCGATPQSMAETLLAKALRTCGNKPNDDMTVVVAKIV